MGGDLPANATRAERTAGPTFFALAHRDPGRPGAPGGLLQRLQVVKGWVDADGELHSEVIDVAGSAENGASVDIDTCRVSGPGHDTLCTVWRDPRLRPRTRRGLLRTRRREPRRAATTSGSA